MGWSCICGKSHAFQVLQPSYHKAEDLRVGGTWLWLDRFDGPQIDETRFQFDDYQCYCLLVCISDIQSLSVARCKKSRFSNELRWHSEIGWSIKSRRSRRSSSLFDTTEVLTV